MIQASQKSETNQNQTKIRKRLEISCQQHTDKVAVEIGGKEWTYSTLFESIEQLRQWLESKVEQGLILFVPKNNLSSLVFVLGSIVSTKIPIFADPAWTPLELQEVIRRCAIQSVVWEGEVPDGLTPLSLLSELDTYRLYQVDIPKSEMQPINLFEDTAFCRFTSGTTGFSRCLQFSSQAAIEAALSWRKAASLSVDDRILCLATLNNGLAFNTSLLSVFLSGSRLIFHPGRLIPSALNRTFASAKPTVLVAFPFVYELLVKINDNSFSNLSELRLAVSSAAPLASNIRDQWKEITALAICDYYGLVEVGPCTFNNGSDPDSVGLPLSGVSFAITSEDGTLLPTGQVGRIRVKTKSMALGYLDVNPPLFSDNVDEKGYYKTRDIGLLTSEGKVILKGRLGRIINIAGRKIDPAEVEAKLRKMDGIQEVVVCSEESENRTLLAAYIESRSVTKDQVIKFCLSHLAQYKVPQLITIVPQFPRSSTGKFSLGRIRQSL